MTKSDRRPLAAAENYYLWMISGGLCSFEKCRKRLVASSDGYLTNIGIKAHIIGHAKNSARHEFANKYGYTAENLEDISNLTLMCQYHAKLIDDHHTRNDFSPELLFKMKKDHEEWVSSWSQDQKKKSIALIYKKLGPPITELTFEGEVPSILLEAVEDQSEFSNYTSEGWLHAKDENINLVNEFKMKIREKSAEIAEIFPLSPIPLLVHIGFLLTDTIPVNLYQFNREKEVWVMKNQVESTKTELNLQNLIVNNSEKELVISVQVSGSIKKDDINDIIHTPYDLLDISISNPGVKRVLYSEDIKEIQQLLKEKVELLIQLNRYERIHLFYAGPAGLAIEIGRGINPRMWGEVYLYQYNIRMEPKYQFTFSI